MIPGSRRNLFKDQSFVECNKAGTKAFSSHAGGAACKGKGGEGGEERTGNGAVDRNEEMGSGCGCLPGA